MSSDITSLPLFATATKHELLQDGHGDWTSRRAVQRVIYPRLEIRCAQFCSVRPWYPGYRYLCRVTRGTGEVHARARCSTRTLHTTLQMYIIVLYEFMQYTTCIVLTETTSWTAPDNLSSVQYLYLAHSCSEYCRKSIPVPNTFCTFCTKLTTEHNLVLSFLSHMTSFALLCLTYFCLG